MGWFGYSFVDIFNYIKKGDAGSHDLRARLKCINNDFDINYYTFSCGSLLNAAIHFGSSNCALVFLDVFKDTINVNLNDFDGNNALMLAVKRNNCLLVEHLLKFNPNIQQYNVENKTAFDLTDSPGILRALKEYEIASHIIKKE